MTNIIISGPCGVGKSATAQKYALQTQMKYLDFDELRGTDMERRKGEISPCSVSYLDLTKCLPPMLENISSNFVLDIGGDTVFRQNTDNEERLRQVLWLKKNYSARIITFIASQEILFQRFVNSKNRNVSEFDKLWEDWLNIGKPYWTQCTDQILDTSILTIEETTKRIEEILKF